MRSPKETPGTDCRRFPIPLRIANDGHKNRFRSHRCHYLHRNLIWHFGPSRLGQGGELYRETVAYFEEWRIPIPIRQSSPKPWE